MRRKRGLYSFEQWGWLTIQIILVVFAIGLVFELYNLFAEPKYSAELQDLKKISSSINSLKESPQLQQVLAASLRASTLKQCQTPEEEDCYNPMLLRLFAARDSQAPRQCRNAACLCGFTEANALIGCERIIAQNCRPAGIACSKTACVREIDETIPLGRGMKVVVCRQCEGDLGIAVIGINEPFDLKTC